jgi:hypothetical protein
MILYRNYNSKHRELRNGEIHLCNLINGNTLVTSNRSLKTMKYSSARKGFEAYDRKGRFLENSYPVFVDKTEYRLRKFLIWSMPILFIFAILILLIAILPTLSFGTPLMQT